MADDRNLIYNMNYRNFYLVLTYFLSHLCIILCEDIFGCGGFVKSNYTINYLRVDIKLYSKQGSLKYQTDCAPNTGYYLIPLYDKGDYVLKIEPPQGWTFEPNSVELHIDGKTDLCSRNQDINFVFKGFTITGQVLSYGQSVGPSNIKLFLKDKSGNTLQETTSRASGTYGFTSVFPGNYIVQAEHDVWLFSESAEHIKIEQDNVVAQNKIVVSGYDVRGHVYSEGEPIQGVHFLLFSEIKLKVPLTGCRREDVRGFSHRGNLHYLCHVTSSSDGSFVFPSIPTGSYKLVPFHKGEHIEFDVSPSEVQFKVQQDSDELGHFQVRGFSVTGRVLENKNGKGVEGAEIYINEKFHTVTGKNGVYHLENMRAGVYELKIETPHIFFDVVSVKVTPNTPQLPEIYASKFSICGHVHIKNYRGTAALSKRLVTLRDMQENFLDNIAVEEDGSFCTIMPPGLYLLEPNVSEEESEFGLLFEMSRRKVHLTHYPILDVVFAQFLATLQGQVRCIDKCNGLVIRVISMTNEDTFLETTTTEDGKFEILECLPGKYVLAVEKDTWCFQSKKLEFTVLDKDVTDLVLAQSGFQASVKVSHQSTFKVKYPSGELHSLFLEKAKNVLCLPESGIYELIQEGCHLFKANTFRFDTNKPLEVDIQASKHLITGSVLTEVNVSDIKISIHKHTSATPDIIPLKEPVELKENVFRYVFSIYVEPNTELDVKVTSSQLLFRPTVAHISVQNDCIDGAVELVGKKGLFIDGMVTPILEGVKIKVLNKDSKAKLSEVQTNSRGKFRVGPLDDDFEYDVTAEKEGYFFTPQGPLGKFQAFKLAEIIVEVVTETGVGLPGVLLSLSGGVEYRKNSLSQKNGKVSFIGLNPGQYFLRPMLKEFQFQPVTKMIDIKEGTQVKVKIIGKRVAFSLFGVINSLTGEAEVGVAVEAVGLVNDNCLQYQEEAISEQGGAFRIRGLQPGCQYSLRLKQGLDVNQHIERATPEETILNVTNSDITNVRIIAFRHFGQMDVSGSIITNQDYLQTMKVRLYCEDNPDQILQTINLGRSGFFFLPAMPIDKRTYILRIDSSLPTSSFAYESPTVTFCANTSFHHFTFSFQPRLKSQEQEVTQGSILALPIAVIVILIVYYHDKALGLAMQLWQMSSSILSNSRSPLSADGSFADTANTRRKLKARRIL